MRATGAACEPREAYYINLRGHMEGGAVIKGNTPRCRVKSVPVTVRPGVDRNFGGLAPWEREDQEVASHEACTRRPIPHLDTRKTLWDQDGATPRSSQTTPPSDHCERVHYQEQYDDGPAPWERRDARPSNRKKIYKPDALEGAGGIVVVDDGLQNRKHYDRWEGSHIKNVTEHAFVSETPVQETPVRRRAGGHARAEDNLDGAAGRVITGPGQRLLMSHWPDTVGAEENGRPPMHSEVPHRRPFAAQHPCMRGHLEGAAARVVNGDDERQQPLMVACWPEGSRPEQHARPSQNVVCQSRRSVEPPRGQWHDKFDPPPRPRQVAARNQKLQAHVAIFG